MKGKPDICLVGSVILDVPLPISPETPIRLGGILHAARCLAALGVKYAAAYSAPSYLDELIKTSLADLGAQEIHKLSDISGAPNTILIGEVKEIGHQGYELLLRDEAKIDYHEDETIAFFRDQKFTDIVVFPGGFPLAKVLATLSSSTADLHIDIGNEVTELDSLSELKKKFKTLFVSTSSKIFIQTFNASVKEFVTSSLDSFAEVVVFKENRGGTRLFSAANPENPTFIGAQLRDNLHSVGVGDCFDMVYVSLSRDNEITSSLNYASWIAAEYSTTFDMDGFLKKVSNVLSLSAEDINQLAGISLPWEERTKYNIYLAAPDFDYIDRTEIDRLADSLRYHNFTPRLPVRENGQLTIGASAEERNRIFEADMKTLAESHILIGVILNDDQGTLVEIGLAKGLGIPTLVFDPFNKVVNLMLDELPDIVSPNSSAIINAVFEKAHLLETNK